MKTEVENQSQKILESSSPRSKPNWIRRNSNKFDQVLILNPRKYKYVIGESEKILLSPTQSGLIYLWGSSRVVASRGHSWSYNSHLVPGCLLTLNSENKLPTWKTFSCSVDHPSVGYSSGSNACTRQMGHVRCSFNQHVIHDRWKMCPHNNFDSLSRDISS